MAELDRIIESIQDWSERGILFALATVVGVRGSTYRGLAARQLVASDGASVGTVSGGCLDTDLAEVARRVIEADEAELVEFDLTADDEAIWGWGIGCNGVTELMVEPASTAHRLARQLAAARAEQRPTVIVHHLDPGSLGERQQLWPTRDEGSGELWDEVRRAVDEGWHRSTVIEDTRVLIEVVGAPSRLVVCGAGHDAAPLVEFGVRLGFEVTVVDDRRHLLTRERFPEGANLVHAEPTELTSVISPDARTYVVLISHNYLRDLDYLRSVVGTKVAYIGALGPGERLERLLKDLEAEGVTIDDSDREKLHGPAGLDIGAEGPAEIAWAIMAEILAFRRSKRGGRLRDRKGPAALQT